MWVLTSDLPRRASHPCYARVNRMLDDAACGRFVEAPCAPFYAAVMGHPSRRRGGGCRLLVVGDTGDRRPHLAHVADDRLLHGRGSCGVCARSENHLGAKCQAQNQLCLRRVSYNPSTPPAGDTRRGVNLESARGISNPHEG